MLQTVGIACKQYRYYDNATNSLDFRGLCEDLRAAPEKSVILLHACAHNPTGLDPSIEQWKEIAQLMKVFIINFNSLNSAKKKKKGKKSYYIF